MEQLICRSVIIMSEDWKNKDIQPYLKGKPANWSDTDNDWVAFKGNEKLEQELASIKKKQSEILERLDKPIDTQVTGSNVEFKKILADKVMPSGSYVTLRNADNSHMRFMTQNVNIGVRWDSSIDWKVRILYVGEETTATIEETEVLSEHNNKNRAITSFKPKNPKALVRLHNDDEDDQNVINVTISQFL